MTDISISTNNIDVKKRLTESLLHNHPEHVPVYVDKSQNPLTPPLGKSKYLVPSTMKVNEFFMAIRQKMTKLPPTHALILTINKVIPSPSDTFGELYRKYKSDDNFLHIQYHTEVTYG